MKKRIIVLFIILSVIVSCVPPIMAESGISWIISDFSGESDIQVSQKSCADGIVSISGTAKSGGYITAAAYSDVHVRDESTLIGISQAKASADGSFELKMGLANGTVKGVVTLSDFESEPMSAYILQSSDEVIISELEDMKNELLELASKCDTAGIPIDYARVKTTVVDKFTQFLNEDLENGNNSRLQSHFEVLQKLYNEAYDELSAYLSGDKIPQSVPRYITSEKRDRTDGVSVIANTEQDGEIKERPIFYVGYGHWEYAEDSVDYFDDMGVNFLHAETGPDRILAHPDPAKDWEYVSGGFLREGSKVELAENAGASGSAIRIVNTTPRDTTSNTHVYGYLGIKQEIEAEPGKTYNFSFKIKGTGIDTDATYYKVGNGNRIKIEKTSYDEFTKISGQYKTGEDETSFAIQFIAENENTEILLDDFNVNKIWTSKNLVLNPGFEDGEGDRTNLVNGFKVKYSEINRLKEVFKKAEDNNVAVALLLSLHYFPAFITAEDSEIDNNGKIYTSFMPVNPTHTRVQEVFETFVQIVLKELGGYKSLESIVLANEPAFNSGHGGNGNPNYYYLSKFRSFLEEKYKTISALNSCYGSSYTDFDEVNMPSWGGIRKSARTKLMVDYIEFNDKIVLDWHTYLVKAIKTINPEMKLQTKIMAYLHETAADDTNVRAENGNEYEELSKLMDLNGHDGGAFPDNENANLESLLQWFDFSRSVNDAPMFNMEDHSMGGDYSAKKAEWIYGYLWQGAIHGRGGTALWRWTRDETSMESYQTDTNFAVRPAETASVGKVALDLNRLADKITPIEKKKAHVAIFYSDKTNVWNNNYLNALYRSYCDVIYTGQKVDYITEYTPEKLNSGDYDVFVVPYATHVPEKVLNEIITFKNNGGKVILTEFEAGSALSCNAYGDAHNSELVSKARNGCEIVRYSSQGIWWDDDWKVYDANNTVSDKIRETVRNYARDAKMLEVRDASTGEYIDKAEYTFAEDENGDVIVNIYSFEDETVKDVNLFYNGILVKKSHELISGKEMGETITLAPYTPLLVNISGTENKIKTVVSLVNKNSSDAEIISYNIKEAEKGIILASFEIPENMTDENQEANFVVAVYEDGKMIGCELKKEKLKKTTVKILMDIEKVTSKTKIKTFVWNNEMQTLSDSKVI